MRECYFKFPPEVREALLWASAVLRSAGVREPRADAEILLSHVLGIPHPFLYAHNGPILQDKWRAFTELVERRRRRVPLPYILGEWEFMGLNFSVRPRVLSPRPETETLVEAVIGEVSERNLKRPYISEVGTGCGAIAISLAKCLPHARFVATDISPFALEVARENAVRHKVEGRIEFMLGDLFSPLRERGMWGKFDVICGNLPYVPRKTLSSLQPEVGRFEPKEALDGGPDGLYFLRRAFVEAHRFVKRGGFCAWEFGVGQWREVRRLIKSSPGVSSTSMRRDLSGRPRVVLAFY